MASGVLHTYPNNFRAFKVLIAGQYSNANIEVSADFIIGNTNKQPDFLEKFPLGKVPAYEDKSGLTLFESNAIAQYVSNDDLTGHTKRDQALIQQWICFSENEILPPAATWVFPILGITQFNKQENEKARANLTAAMTVLNQHLLTRTFLVGEHVTLADIITMCNLLLPYEHVFEPEYRNTFGNVNRWFTTMINQPHVKNIVPTFTLCVKAGKFDPVKYAEIHGIQKKEKKQPAKKEASTPKKEEPKPDEEEEPSATEQEAKAFTDPLDALPAGTFNMNEFKRTYCNLDTRTVTIPYFWEHFDSNNYSIWIGEYKYNDELTRVFMSKNLVGGMVQRLDKLNKNAFACINVYGEDNNNSIAGLWIWRGQELAFTLNDSWSIDYDTYTWTKLDPSDPKHRELVEAYLICEDEVNGKKINKTVVFK